MSGPVPGPFGVNRCGCTVGKLGQYISIDYCDLHQAAPDLLEALKGLESRHEPGVFCDHAAAPCHRCDASRDAIAKATGATP